MFPLWLAAVAQGLAKREQDAQARKEKAAQIAGQFSSSMGMPQYELEAAQTNTALQEQPGMDFLKLYMSQKGHD